MDKLEELVQAHCPQGAKYVLLESVCQISKGIQFNKSDMNDSGTYPVINGGITASGYIEQYNQEENTITISQGGASAGYVNWIETKFWAGAHCYVLKPSDKVLNRYLFHFVKSKEQKLQECQYGAGIPALAKSTVASLQIPLPPLPVQQEIVRILDSFTELTAELNEKLAAELTARRKQYEHYRDELLTFGDDVPFVKLGDSCHVITKGTTPKAYTQSGVTFIKTEAIDGNSLNYSKLSYIDVETHNTTLKRSILKTDDILITIAGATIGKCAMVPEKLLPANTNQALAIVRLNETVCKKYIFYILQSHYMKEYINASAKGSAQPNLNLEQLNNFKFPLPPLAEQKRIVETLERFDAICNDLTSGLPAEITARQKQYEYYRGKLLTFKELDT